MRKSGRSLVIAGLLGLLFFWLTDPHYGWFGRLGSTGNPVDDANHAFVSTVLGLVGSLLVLGIGIWLMTRRTA